MNRNRFEGLDHRARGRRGEDVARRWLMTHGFDIVATNFACRSGEIDVIAREGDVLCFIEVKARTSDRFGTAIEAVSPRKQRRIGRAASWYLARQPYDGPCRFDVLALDQQKDGWRITLARDAFALS